MKELSYEVESCTHEFLEHDYLYDGLSLTTQVFVPGNLAPPPHDRYRLQLGKEAEIRLGDYRPRIGNRVWAIE